MADARDDNTPPVREGGELLAAIESGFRMERRAHGPAVDGYITIITWQEQGGGRPWEAVDHWELSPEVQRRLAEVLAKFPRSAL